MAEAPNNRLVSVAEMRHAVIGGKTYDGYKYELWRLFEYGREHPQLNWFTPYASALLDEMIHTELATIIQGSRHQSRRKWALLREMLNDCHNNPILNIPISNPNILHPIHPRPEVCKWHLLQGKGLWEQERCITPSLSLPSRTGGLSRGV